MARFLSWRGGNIDCAGERAGAEVSDKYVASVVVVAASDAVAGFNTAPLNSVPTVPPQYLNNAWLLATLVQGAQIDACYVALLERWGSRLSGIDVYGRSHCEEAYAFVSVDRKVQARLRVDAGLWGRCDFSLADRPVLGSNVDAGCSMVVHDLSCAQLGRVQMNWRAQGARSWCCAAGNVLPAVASFAFGALWRGA